MTNLVQVSFIIPTYNEERFLLHTLECIDVYKPKLLACEIIVADNGSEDETTVIAKKYASVLEDKCATVGGLRNLAVKSSRGEVIVFLDADVLLTDVWCKNFNSTYESLLEKPYQITGSRCTIPKLASWIEIAWFKPLVSQNSSYINSGHLITTRKLFDKISGFDSVLETGEDYAFGQSALSVKAVINNNPLLEVVHEGYPKTLLSFIKREIWHGTGDSKSLNSLFASKVALASMGFFCLHLIFFYGVVSGYYVISSISLTLIILMCFSAAVMKHKVRGVRNILNVSFLYYFYFSARLLSWFPFLNKREAQRDIVNVQKSCKN